MRNIKMTYVRAHRRNILKYQGRCPFFCPQLSVDIARELWSLPTCERDAVHTSAFLYHRRTQPQSQCNFPRLLRTSVASRLAPHLLTLHGASALTYSAPFLPLRCVPAARQPCCSRSPPGGLLRTLARWDLPCGPHRVRLPLSRWVHSRALPHVLLLLMMASLSPIRLQANPSPACPPGAQVVVLLLGKATSAAGCTAFQRSTSVPPYSDAPAWPWLVCCSGGALPRDARNWRQQAQVLGPAVLSNPNTFFHLAPPTA